MSRIIRFIFQAFVIFLSVLAGNWVGGQVRSEQTGLPVDPLVSEFTVGSRRYKNFPSVMRFYPAVLLTITSRPRWFWGFAWGFLAGRFVDDTIDQVLLSRIFSFLEE